MATKNTPISIPAKPIPVRESTRTQDIQKSHINRGGRILGEDARQTTVFQTRPTPVDPGKK